MSMIAMAPPPEPVEKQQTEQYMTIGDQKVRNPLVHIASTRLYSLFNEVLEPLVQTDQIRFEYKKGMLSGTVRITARSEEVAGQIQALVNILRDAPPLSDEEVKDLQAAAHDPVAEQKKVAHDLGEASISGEDPLTVTFTARGRSSHMVCDRLAHFSAGRASAATARR